jgi:hypothetical protein
LILHSQTTPESGFQLGGPALSASAQLFFGLRGEPALDQIDPREAGRLEMCEAVREPRQQTPNRGLLRVPIHRESGARPSLLAQRRRFSTTFFVVEGKAHFVSVQMKLFQCIQPFRTCDI